SEIYPVPGQRSGNPLSAEGYEKNPIAAGLLAFFLGGLGVHKFYMGYSSEGAILLAATVVSWILIFIIIGIFGLMAIGIVCLVEAVIYITKSPAEFNRIYIENRRPWF
ncbi:MAG: TM2 domain-containing protein, partial [Alteraurantiacibacter sp.]